MENCDLRKETQDLRHQLEELQKALDDLELESAPNQSSASAPGNQNRNTVDALRSALRKHATLYDPFPPKDRQFYQQPRPDDITILTDFEKRYKDQDSEAQANLGEFYVTLPDNHMLRLSDGDLDLVRQVCACCIYHIIFPNSSYLQIIEEARKIRSWMLLRSRDVAEYIFNLPPASNYFSANRGDEHPTELQKLFKLTPSTPFTKFAPILYPPEVRFHRNPPPHQLFKSPEVAKVFSTKTLTSLMISSNFLVN